MKSASRQLAEKRANRSRDRQPAPVPPSDDNRYRYASLRSLPTTLLEARLQSRDVEFSMHNPLGSHVLLTLLRATAAAIVVRR